MLSSLSYKENNIIVTYSIKITKAFRIRIIKSQTIDRNYIITRVGLRN